jgi:glycosyltransferase involved in cell wall biosynthesis
MDFKHKPTKVLITGGHEKGGVDSFAEALAQGFTELGISAEITSPAALRHRWRDLRDENTLKILSTQAIFASAFAKRSICVAHGFPGAGQIGRAKFYGHLSADRLAIFSPGAKLVTVSEYAAIHFRDVFNIRVNGVVRNPLKQVFLEPPIDSSERNRITYAGRLSPVKNVPLILEAMIEVLNDRPELEAYIVGIGTEQQTLERIAEHHPRVKFTGAVGDIALRDCLRKTKAFISCNETEQFGITYLEALSQGCNVVMPACGGGLEIAPALVAGQIQLAPLPLGRESLKNAILRAVGFEGAPMRMDEYSPRAVASAYLRVDSGLLDTQIRPAFESSGRPPLATRI